MKTAIIATLAFAAIASAPAFADNHNAPLTRAEVRAELAQAHAAGEAILGDAHYVVLVTSTAVGKTRAEVQAELAQAQAVG